MTDATIVSRGEENASPAQLPLFVGSSASSKKRGRTYARPKVVKKKRRSIAKKTRKSGSKGRRRHPNSDSDGVPRCAL